MSFYEIESTKIRLEIQAESGKPDRDWFSHGFGRYRRNFSKTELIEENSKKFVFEKFEKICRKQC